MNFASKYYKGETMKPVKCKMYSEIVGYHMEYVFKTDLKNLKLELRSDKKERGLKQFESMLEVLKLEPSWKQRSTFNRVDYVG
jgi:hypothetical protein